MDFPSSIYKYINSESEKPINDVIRNNLTSNEVQARNMGTRQRIEVTIGLNKVHDDDIEDLRTWRDTNRLSASFNYTFVKNRSAETKIFYLKEYFEIAPDISCQTRYKVGKITLVEK